MVSTTTEIRLWWSWWVPPKQRYSIISGISVSLQNPDCGAHPLFSSILDHQTPPVPWACSRGTVGTVGGGFYWKCCLSCCFLPKQLQFPPWLCWHKGEKCQIKEEELFCAAGTGDVTRRGGSACAQTLQLLPGYFQFSFIDFTSLLVNIKASWAVSQHK